MGTVIDIEKRIDYYFDDRMLLKRALTHPSVTKEVDGKPFERLEFLGDRVLGLVIAELLYNEFPTEWEGELARRFSYLVRKDMLLEVAHDMGLKEFMLVPEEKGSGIHKHYDTIWADGCEAFLGAIYLDGGLEPVHRVIKNYWQEKLRSSESPPIDPKNALQEWSQGAGFSLPTYIFISQAGPDHAPEFIMEATLDIGEGRILMGRGQGPSKKAAEKEAASYLLAEIMKAFPE
jgi:ribonuclease-3